MVPSDTGVIELDGLKAAPVVHESDGATFLEKGAAVLRERFISRFRNPEAIDMTVLAFVRGAGEG
eukprot:44667-Eustigmatos_ZCMA.PRE.1